MADEKQVPRYQQAGSPYVSKERLAAYIAAFKTTTAEGEHKTFGQIVEETVEEVEERCAKGELGIAIAEFERDPDAELDKALDAGRE